MDQELITFSFGKNWRSYVDTVSEASIQRAKSDIEEWLGSERVKGKTVLDVGCGSGIHSLCYYLMDAKEVFSFDVDQYSVETTQVLWEKVGKPSNWRVMQGSILDQDLAATIGKHEIVYSWGVLHHTGAMWKAIENAACLVKRGGLFWIAIYVKGPKYPEHLALKKSYNRASKLGKKLMVWNKIAMIMRDRWKAGLNPFAWNEQYGRGMNVYHDLLDWLGGLPYEVASKEEIVDFCTERGFVLEKITELPEGGNNVYLFSLPG